MANRPQPSFPEPDTQHFWEGCKAGELRYQTDSDGNVVFYPRGHSTVSGDRDLTWRVSSGLGTVYTYSVVRQNRMPGFQELGAYAVAYIDLDEGFRMMSTVVGVSDPTSEIHIGQRVKVEFEEQEGDDAYPIPVFRPV